MDVKIDEMGTAIINLSADLLFAGETSHSPIFIFPVRQDAKDPNYWIAFDIRFQNVSSPDGVSTRYSSRESSGIITVRMGDRDRTVKGKAICNIKY